MTHEIQWFFSTGIHDPAWVQAIAAVAVVVFTFVTFIVLFIYAYDTHTLAKASVEQVRNTLTPFLTLVRVEQRDERGAKDDPSVLSPSTCGVWVVQNQGNSAAINIQIDGKAETAKDSLDDFEEFLTPLAVGEHSTLKILPTSRIKECTIIYESLDAWMFKTTLYESHQRLWVNFKRYDGQFLRERQPSPLLARVNRTLFIVHDWLSAFKNSVRRRFKPSIKQG